jgi:hypothetical protein
LWAIKAVLRKKQVLNSIRFFDDNIKIKIDKISQNASLWLLPKYQDRLKQDLKQDIASKLQKELGKANLDHAMGLLIAAAVTFNQNSTEAPSIS